ncbi:MAG: wax ester/triacylglycerol synthase family O-acyltransferase [Rhodocyclales bacterium]|nr:wax ester/triacylglycerol synthase family O-acyltransferase [Rhodocyclales bacterium]
MSGVDTAWLHMDRPTNLMMIVGVLMLEERVDFERLQRTIAARLLHFERFRQCVVEDATGASWVADREFDIAAHVHRAALPSPADKATLEAFVGELAATPLDPARPLWQMHFVENYNGGSALVARIHHCIADGIALIGVLMSLTDTAPDAPAPAPPHVPHGGHKSEHNPWSALFDPLAEALTTSLRWSGKAWIKYFEMIANPAQTLGYAEKGLGFANELAKLALMPDDSKTRFKGKAVAAKRVAWSAPMPLAEVKTVGRGLGCSVNDVLLSCVAGALRAYLVAKGDTVDGVELRALVPVNLRSGRKQGKLGNKFGLVTLSLPVGIANPVARVYEVRRRMAELKGSYQAIVALGLLGAAGLAPKWVQSKVLDVLANKATAVMTNVPGPQQPLYLAGSRLAQTMFWVPQSGDIGMGVSILSFDGGVQFGLIGDAARVPDPQAIVDGFAPEFEKLLLALLLAPWGGEVAADVLEQTLEEELKPYNPAPVRRRRKTQARDGKL